MPRNVRGSVEIHSAALESGTLPILHRAVREVAHDIEREAKRLAPVRTGRLRDSIHTTGPFTTGKLQVHATVETGTHYARFVHSGTRPHLIRARHAKALRFYWDRVGRVVFFDHVNHPGTTANPFMTIAAESVAARHR